MKLLLFMARKEFAQRSEVHLRKTERERSFNIRSETNKGVLKERMCLKRKKRRTERVPIQTLFGKQFVLFVHFALNGQLCMTWFDFEY